MYATLTLSNWLSIDLFLALTFLNWVNVDLLINLMLAVVAAWLIIKIFVVWRHSVTNLTPTETARRNRSMSPDFLQVDHVAREAALARGDEFAEQLLHREGQRVSNNQTLAWIGRILGWTAAIMAAVVLAVLLAGQIWPDSYIGHFTGNFSSGSFLKVIQSETGKVITAGMIFFASLTRWIMTRFAGN